jgi:hypothetical protein
MPLTHFQHGIFATPTVGAGLGYGWKVDSTTYFVDGTNGSDSNGGTSPDKAFATIQHAIDSADKHDVIYIFDQDLASSGTGSTAKYTEDITVSKTKHNLSLIGASRLVGFPVRECGIQNATAVANLIVSAGSLTVENLRFSRGNSGTHGIWAESGEDTTDYGHGAVIYNCRFTGFAGTAAGNAAIRGVGLQGMQIINCQFVDNYIDIWFVSSTGTATDLLIKNCLFSITAVAATAKSADIVINTQGSGYVAIMGNCFAHIIPAAGYTRYISIADTRQGCVSFNSFSTGYNNNLTIGAAGTACTIPTALNSGPNWGNSALMAASA